MKIVEVEWLDSQMSSGWRHKDTIEEVFGKTTCLCASIGYLVLEDEDKIMLAQNLGDWFEGDTQACNTMIIPRCSIKNIKEIKSK